MIRLETERLIIRDHRPGDLEGLYRLLADPRAMHFLPDLQVTDLDGARANLATALAQAARADRRKYFFAIIEKASGAYVGEIGFTVLDEPPPGRAVELGYFILEAFWGRGLVTEAARRVVRFAFEACGVARIRIGCCKANQASERVMVKLGAMPEREYAAEPPRPGETPVRVAYLLVHPGRS